MDKATDAPEFREGNRIDASRERVVVVVPESTPPTIDEGPGLGEMWAAVWKAKWLVIAIASVCGGAAAIYAFQATPWYHAEVLLMPATERSGGSISGGLAQLSSLASVAGISIGGSSGPNGEALAVLRSREFASTFIEQEKLLTVLLVDDWDAQRGRWKTTDPRKTPDIRDAVKYFDQHVRQVQDDKKTGLVALSIEWTDSKTAADWANLLVDRLNEQMRQRALTDAEANVAFLQKELSATNVVTLQQSIGRLLESELEKVMIARGNKEFSYHVVDRAVPPKWRARPQRVQIVALAGLGGAVLAALGVLIRSRGRERKVPEQSRAG